MKRRSQIQINRFQLGVLLNGLEKEFLNCIIENMVYCSHCGKMALKGIFVKEIYLTKQNDVKVFGICKACSTDVVRLFEFGIQKEFFIRADNLRSSIHEYIRESELQVKLAVSDK